MGTGGGGVVANVGTSELLQLFAEGSQVEISSDEEGFKGAWYVATILEPPSRSSSKKKNQNYKLYVEYQTLLSDEDGSKPLREHVNVAFVRPLPPPSETDIGRSFELNDVVDGFYRDGWWTGVITEALDDSRFLVTFQNPPDVIEFGISDLRVHREWVDGKWVRPEKQRTTGLMFSAGEKVEVSFEEEKYRDVWFPAIVLKDSGDNSCLVEYQSSGISEEARLLKVTVDSLHIRPSPPHLKDKNFVLFDKVDAFYDFGWWSGVITKELADSRYIVFFKHMKKEREFNHSELRRHMEWKDGKWFGPSEEVIPSNYQEVCNNANSTEMAVPLGSSGATKDISEERTPSSLISTENQTDQLTPCNEKPSHVMTSPKKKTKQPPSDSDDTHSRPSKKLKEGNSAEASSSKTCQLSTMPMQTPNKETFFDFTSPTSGSAAANCSKPPMVDDLSSTKTEILSRGKKVQSKREKVYELGNLTTDPVKRKGRPVKAQVKSPQPSAEGKVNNAVGNVADDSVEKESITKEVDIPVIIGLECTGVRSSRVKKPRQSLGEESPKLKKDQKQELNDLKIRNMKVGCQLDEGGESNQKKKRGRPPKILIKSPKASVAVKEPNGDVAADKMIVKDCIANEVDMPTIAGLGSTRMGGSVPSKEYLKLTGDDKRLLDGPLKQKNKLSSMTKIPLAKKDKLPHGKVVQASGKHGKRSSKSGRRRTISVNIESPIQDSQDALGGKTSQVFVTDSMMKEVEMPIDNLPTNVSDDQPLSMWFEGMHSPTVEGSRVSPGRTVQQSTELGERPNVILMPSPAVDAKGNIVSGDSRSLPFVKNTPLWETIESMEVFQMMPQKPHFRPLDGRKESSREGLAIGSMVTFSSVVEKTLKLQFDDPRSTIEDNLDTLLELENYGFDVRVVRHRLTGLLLIKDRQEQLQEQSKELENEIMEHNVEETKIDEEIDEIDKQIRELQEKRALAMSMKEIKASEIASLESRVGVTNEGIRTVRLEFEGLAAAPW